MAPAVTAGEVSGSRQTATSNIEATRWPQYVLQAEAWWLLDLPEARRFDASALVLQPTEELWTVNDQSTGVYRIQLKDGIRDASLVRIPGLLDAQQVFALLQTRQPGARLDCEGLARDDRGRLYISEESHRWILRWDPGTRDLTRLDIDWSPVAHYFHPLDLNASFEGVAVGGSRLYVANERQEGRILVVDLASLKVIDDFAVAQADSAGDDTHYSDLCWAEDSLWVLLRDVHRLLRVDPAAKRVIAEFDFTALETRREVAYGSFFAPGFMEGLAVDSAHIWLLTDNNGMNRRADGKDIRPTLFRCPRPDRSPPPSSGSARKP